MNLRLMLLLFFFLFGFVKFVSVEKDKVKEDWEKVAVKEFSDRNIQTVTNNLYRHYTWIFAFGVKQSCKSLMGKHRINWQDR